MRRRGSAGAHGEPEWPATHLRPDKAWSDAFLKSPEPPCTREAGVSNSRLRQGGDGVRERAHLFLALVVVHVVLCELLLCSSLGHGCTRSMASGV